MLSPTSQRSDAIARPTGPEAEVLETLQPVPDEWDVDSDSGSGNDPTEDVRETTSLTKDVNGLSLSLKHPTSYLGISCPPAVLRVIRWLDPECRAVFTELQASRASSSQHPARKEAGEVCDPCSPNMGDSSPWNEIPLINAYFTCFHPSNPLIDEESFRATYLSQSRIDPSWHLLLNVVLTLGSVATNTADDLSHTVFYDRAKQYLTPEIFGPIHWETVQALTLLGGVYLHYLERPDEGNIFVGAALRMALALGLHRDCAAGLASAIRPKAGSPVGAASPRATPLAADMRRRIWWSLFNIDTWCGTALGRPSMGRMSPAVTTKLPVEPIVSLISSLLEASSV